MNAGSQCRQLAVEELTWDGKSYKAVDLGGQMGGRHTAVAAPGPKQEDGGPLGGGGHANGPNPGGFFGALGGAPPLGGPPSGVKYLYLVPIGDC